MKSILFALLLSLVNLAAQAQHEQDFVTHYMEQYGKDNNLTHLTVGPSMIKAILKIDDCKEDPELESFLKSVKSVQMLTSVMDSTSVIHYDRVEKMVQQNPGRYKMLIEHGGQRIYARRRGDAIVEIVMFMDENDSFLLVDITGEITDKQLKRIVHSEI